MRARRRSLGAALVLAAAVPLPACHSDSDPGPGGVTRGDGRALDEAAATLERAAPTAPGQAGKH